MPKLIFIGCLFLFPVIVSACGQDKTTIKTIIQTQYSTVYVPFLRYTTVYSQPASPTGTTSPTEQITPILTDTTGTVALLSVVPIENFRTADNVNFSTQFRFQNLSSARVNFGWTINGKDSAGTVVFVRSLNMALDGLQTTTNTVSYGEPLTITQYDSITRWVVTDLIRY